MKDSRRKLKNIKSELNKEEPRVLKVRKASLGVWREGLLENYRHFSVAGATRESLRNESALVSWDHRSQRALQTMQ